MKRLREIGFLCRNSSFFKEHDMIGSSLLFVNDESQANIWMIDLPWDILDIEVMTVETQHAGKVFPGTIQGIRQFLEEKGYVHVYTVAGHSGRDVALTEK